MNELSINYFNMKRWFFRLSTATVLLAGRPTLRASNKRITV